MRNFTSSLRHKVLLERQTQTADGGGGYATAWETVATLWAEIRHMRGNESFAGGQLTARATHIFRLRYSSDITTAMRFSYDGRIFNIRALHNLDEKSRVLDVVVEEG